MIFVGCCVSTLQVDEPQTMWRGTNIAGLKSSHSLAKCPYCVVKVRLTSEKGCKGHQYFFVEFLRARNWLGIFSTLCFCDTMCYPIKTYLFFVFHFRFIHAFQVLFFVACGFLNPQFCFGRDVGLITSLTIPCYTLEFKSLSPSRFGQTFSHQMQTLLSARFS